VPCLVRISEAASLALHSMALLARYPELQFSNHSMAERLNASSHHLAKVMQLLVKAGLVKSQRGPSGGFRLAVAAANIALLQIYEAVDGPISHDGCLLHKRTCNGNTCILGNLVYTLHEQIRNCLANTTLADFSLKLALVNNSVESCVC
jgi:Rrf2 family nitric oxide-sensitive transcriptional repressor